MKYINRLAAEAHLHECVVLSNKRFTSGTGSPETDGALRTALRQELADLALITGAEVGGGEDGAGDFERLYGALVSARIRLDHTIVGKAIIGFSGAERDRLFDECLTLAGEAAVRYLGPLAGPLMRERAGKFRDITVTAPEEDAR